MKNNNSDKTLPKNTKAEDANQSKRVVKIKNLTSKQKSFLQGAASGLAGISIGAAVMAMMGWSIKDEKGGEDVPSGKSEQGGEISNITNRATGDEEMEIPIHDSAPFSDAVTDDMNFNEAFAAARQDEGPGAFFEWHGETYNTYYKEEWDELSDDEKNDFFSSIDENFNTDDVTDTDEILDILNDDDDDIEESPDHEDIVIIDDDEDIDGDDDSIVINDDDDYDGNEDDDKDDDDDDDDIDDNEDDEYGMLEDDETV